MRRIPLALALLLALAPAAGPTQAQTQPVDASAPRLSPQDFADRAWTAGQFAIAASEVALKKSLDLKVRRLAEAIIDDYQRGNAFLMEAAAVNRLRLPDRLDDDLQGRLDRLAAVPVDRIDAAFTEMVSEIHRRMIPIFTDYARSGDILSLRILASQALPTLQEHYGSVLQLASR